MAKKSKFIKGVSIDAEDTDYEKASLLCDSGLWPVKYAHLQDELNTAVYVSLVLGAVIGSAMTLAVLLVR